ncbi:rhomboid family intramembrane serine protease [Lewinella sp. W8]|uniref:rhomboid family intramembrane serine protease n=1 Tax=Lewinella sp. W8 TaxID=2528208 RepID=UPI0010683F31|nr:rhomboid family intramembrane serine protease [Lewinella sp. W8]MTB51927.1 rhomboid family intramembrane serine protease [Lewinella sp. W8]
MISKRNLKNVVVWPLAMLAIIWAISIINFTVMGGQWSYWYSLHPRELSGVFGIFLSPLFHGDWAHLLSNSFPFLTLSGLLVFFYPRLWPRVLSTLWIGTGTLVWLLGRDVYHIGASGVVYALAAFLAFSGIFRRDFRAVVVSLVVLFYYGGMVVGILPGQEGISWESHLLGLVMGAFGGWLFRGQLEDHEIETKRRNAARHQPREKEQFLDPDTFSKTRQERQQEAFWERMRKVSEREKLDR